MKLGEHAPICPTTDCDKSIETKLSSTGSSLHVYVKEEEWEVIYRSAIDGKESETECAIISDEHLLEIEVCAGIREADSDCIHASRNQKRQF